MAKCRIHYTAFSIQVDFEPGCENFEDWVALKVPRARWNTEESRFVCIVTDEEAKYIENIATCQWGPQKVEVIGKPVSIEAKPANNEQLGLF